MVWFVMVIFWSFMIFQKMHLCVPLKKFWDGLSKNMKKVLDLGRISKFFIKRLLEINQNIFCRWCDFFAHASARCEIWLMWLHFWQNTWQHSSAIAGRIVHITLHYNFVFWRTLLKNVPTIMPQGWMAFFDPWWFFKNVFCVCRWKIFWVRPRKNQKVFGTDLTKLFFYQNTFGKWKYFRIRFLCFEREQTLGASNHLFISSKCI